MSNEKPILFGGSMVRAILDGRKTQTRRVVKPQPPDGAEYDTDGTSVVYHASGRNISDYSCPHPTGSYMWVRETYGLSAPDNVTRRTVYRADGEQALPTKWRSSIFMPRRVSRITLRVAGVRVQRVQEITEVDAIAEGVGGRCVFAELWDSINAKRGYGWNTNPLVWAYTFERVERWGRHERVYTI